MTNPDTGSKCYSPETPGVPEGPHSPAKVLIVEPNETLSDL